MSEGINKVMLLGRLGKTPELRVTQAGLSVLQLRVATNDSYLDKEKVRRERTEWHAVVIFGRRAEALSKILVKGMPVFVEGSLRSASYEREGTTHKKTEIVAKELLLVGSAGKGGDAELGEDESAEPIESPPPRAGAKGSKAGRGSRARAESALTLPHAVSEELALSERAYGESAYAEGGERDIPF
jgi:single-strand DNA-binding protein